MTFPLVKSFPVLLLGLCLLGRGPVHGQTPAPEMPAIPARGLLLEVLVAGPKVYSEISGAKKTVLAPAYQDTIGTRVYTAKSWAALAVPWEEFVREAMVHADALIEKIQPEVVRNSAGVAEYAILQSEDPYLTSTLFSKKFLPKFSEIFGKELHVVPLTRGRIYVFPAQGRPLSEFGIAEEYANLLVPLTLEVFQITKEGPKVIGEIIR